MAGMMKRVGGVIATECCLSQERHNGYFNLKMMLKLLCKNHLLEFQRSLNFNQNKVNVLTRPTAHTQTVCIT